MKRFIYTAPLIVSKEEPVKQVCDKIIALGTNEALVKNDHDDLCGIVCLYDICKYFSSSNSEWSRVPIDSIMHKIEVALYFSSLITDLKNLDTQFCYRKIPVFLNRDSTSLDNLMGCFDLELFGKSNVKNMTPRALKNIYQF